jgi:hypothetical protein
VREAARWRARARRQGSGGKAAAARQRAAAHRRDVTAHAQDALHLAGRVGLVVARQVDGFETVSRLAHHDRSRVARVGEPAVIVLDETSDSGGAAHARVHLIGEITVNLDIRIF